MMQSCKFVRRNFSSAGWRTGIFGNLIPIGTDNDVPGGGPVLKRLDAVSGDTGRYCDPSACDLGFEGKRHSSAGLYSFNDYLGFGIRRITPDHRTARCAL